MMKTFAILLTIYVIRSEVYCKNPKGNSDSDTDEKISAALTALAGGKGFIPTPLFNETNTVRNPIQVDVTFWCRNRTSNQDVQVFANETDIGSKTVKNQPYFFIIHGWLFTRNIQWVQDMVRDFGLYVPDVNVCTVDWSKLAYYEYDIASNRNVYDVGNFLAQAITNWKLKLDAVSLLGHTLGAHIAGQTGLVLKGKIAKIFGVDPAGPIFCHPNPKSPDRRLTKDDAKYVQHISTSGGFSGCALESGSQIFYPAGGARQPGCNPAQFDSIDTEICSHLIGTEYFRASLQRQNVFGAKKCKSWFFYLTGLCANGPSDMMGYYANGIPGGFYLDVAKQGPFTKP